jgi:methylmalonyl-CoA mutase
MNDITAAKSSCRAAEARQQGPLVTAACRPTATTCPINTRRILEVERRRGHPPGHNCSVDICLLRRAEDVRYRLQLPGGHVEYFKYMIDLLRQRGGGHIKVPGGGGVIVPSEIEGPERLRRDP